MWFCIDLLTASCEHFFWNEKSFTEISISSVNPTGQESSFKCSSLRTKEIGLVNSDVLCHESCHKIFLPLSIRFLNWQNISHYYSHFHFVMKHFISPSKMHLISHLRIYFSRRMLFQMRMLHKIEKVHPNLLKYFSKPVHLNPHSFAISTVATDKIRSILTSWFFTEDMPL